MTTLAFTSPVDEATRRRLLWALPTGLYVVGTTGGDGGPFNLMTESLVAQVAVEPCVVALSVEVGAVTHGLLEATGVATLTVLRRDQRALVRKFVKPVDDVVLDEDGRPVELAGMAVALAPSGAPYLVDAAGCFDLRVVERVAFASHTLFCGKVTGAVAAPEVLEGTASQRLAEILRMEDTKMSYGG